MDSAVEFVDVYKEYPFYQHITAGFKSFIFNLPKNIKTFKKTRFDVLKGVTFDIKKGETFGIIGRNGSGKSTILSLIAGVIKQDRGIVKTCGKISSLLELGSGFHPDLSGIENIILNGILMGNTRQDMLEKADEIVEFSELGDFIYQPLRTYSSGMHVRLGFSVAVHINPEILLIDEALAVGDSSFQEKCMKKMLDFRASGATIILVSHDMMSIAKLCDRVAWIDSGSVMVLGKPKEVIKGYMGYFNQETSLFTEEEPHEGEGPTTAMPSVPGLSDDLVHEASWWDSPVVLHECEVLITGKRDLNIYDFLKNVYNIKELEKGLSLCNRLHGFETNFMSHSVCKSFDVINKREVIAAIVSGEADFKKDTYDLLLLIDVVHRMKDPYAFMRDASCALKDSGIIIAFEYTGPAGFAWSEKEKMIAGMILGVFDDEKKSNEILDVINSFSPRAPSVTGSGEAISKYEVIPVFEKFFDVFAIRYFGGPLYNLLLDKLMGDFATEGARDSALIKTIIRFEQVLIKEGILRNNYAMILAKKTRQSVHL